MAAAVWTLVRTLSSIAPGTGTAIEAVRLAIIIGAGLLVLAIAARLLRIAEFDEIVSEMRGRAQKLL